MNSNGVKIQLQVISKGHRTTRDFIFETQEQADFLSSKGDFLELVRSDDKNKLQLRYRLHNSCKYMSINSLLGLPRFSQHLYVNGAYDFRPPMKQIVGNIQLQKQQANTETVNPTETVPSIELSSGTTQMEAKSSISNKTSPPIMAKSSANQTEEIVSVVINDISLSGPKSFIVGILINLLNQK
ncbi:MAG: hypothetical protein ACXW2E_01550 [Nitrososphaeraceae archaeon]